MLARGLRLLDPRPSWRALRSPLPGPADAQRLARAVRTLGRMMHVAVVLSVGVLLLNAAVLLFIGSVLNDSLPLLGAVLSPIFYTGVLFLAVAALVAAGLVGVLLRPVAALYIRVLRGDPLPAAAVRGGGAFLCMTGLACPILFLYVVFETTTWPILASTFVLATLSPFLLRAGWGLLRAPLGPLQ